MILDTRQLLMFFLTENFKMSSEREAYWFSDAPSDNELAHQLKYVTNAVMLVMGGKELEADDIEALIWLINEYCHRELKIPARLDIWHHLAQAARTEPSLHVLCRFYRDHFFHAIEVCLLGHVILDTIWSDGEPLWRKVGNRLKPRAEKEKVLRLWYITALFHDTGYCIELVKGAQQRLEFFQNALPLKRFTIDLQKTLAALSKQLVEEGFDGLTIEDIGGEDHGVIGARHLKGLLQKIAKKDYSFNAEEYQPAVQAIARHNLRRKQKVCFQTEPLTFLLILCDTLQEWDRPRLPYTTAPYYLLSMLQGGESRWEGMQGPLKNFSLNLETSSNRQERFKLRRRNNLHVILRFDNHINLNDTLFYTWLDATCNLQRLEMTGLNGDIEIEYISPPALINGQWLRQLQRLQDSSRETRMNFMDGWFPDRSQANIITNEIVSYWVEAVSSESDGNRELEHLKIHLKKLTEKEPIKGSIEDFSKRFEEWEHYNNNREFLSGYGLPDSPG